MRAYELPTVVLPGPTEHTAVALTLLVISVVIVYIFIEHGLQPACQAWVKAIVSRAEAANHQAEAERLTTDRIRQTLAETVEADKQLAKALERVVKAANADDLQLLLELYATHQNMLNAVEAWTKYVQVTNASSRISFTDFFRLGYQE